MKTFLLLLTLSFNAFAFDISSGISGSWYDRTNPGQGFNIEILEGNHIVVYWYSYDRGKPVWLAGSGTYQGNVATVELFYIQGSDFGTHHNSGSNVRKSFGTTIFTFDNCDSGSMTYNSSLSFGSGSLRLDRLTTLSGLRCLDTGTSRPANPSTPPPLSGNVVELKNISWELGACKLSGTRLICDFRVTSTDKDVEIELLSSRGGTTTNVDGNILTVEEVKLGDHISRSIFFGPRAVLKRNVGLNGHVIFDKSTIPTGIINVDFLNLAFKLNQEVFDIEYFNVPITNQNR